MPELEVGHVDVDEPIHQPKGGEAIVRAGVVDDGDAKPARNRHRESLGNLGSDVLRRDEVDVVATSGLELERELGDSFRFELPTGCFLADIPVLAEDAAQIAETKKDGPASVPPAQAILFSKVWKGRAHHRVAPGVTDASLVL
jgi:hypothetical protein